MVSTLSKPPYLDDINYTISRLVFYFPMVGLSNLFLKILKHHSDPSAQTDIALLDIAVGHFGHLEVITESELSYPFAREIASIAYQTVKKYHERLNTPKRPDTPSEAVSSAPDINLNIPSEVGSLSRYLAHSNQA